MIGVGSMLGLYYRHKEIEDMTPQELNQESSFIRYELKDEDPDNPYEDLRDRLALVRRLQTFSYKYC